MQAQDFPGAKWALGLRLRGGSDVDVERAFAEGSILRTHVLRPTWHFVVPEDVRWMLALTGPRVLAQVASYYRKLGLDAAVLARSHDALARALEGGRSRTHAELRAVLDAAGVPTESPCGWASS